MGFTHIDCFSGPGGICTGMHAAGFETKVAIEFIQSCCDTYSANHPEVEVLYQRTELILLPPECRVRRSRPLATHRDPSMTIGSFCLGKESELRRYQMQK